MELNTLKLLKLLDLPNKVTIADIKAKMISLGLDYNPTILRYIKRNLSNIGLDDIKPIKLLDNDCI